MELRKNEIPWDRMNKREKEIARWFKEYDECLYLAYDHIDGGYWVRRKDPRYYVSFTIIKVPTHVSLLWLKDWFRSHNDADITQGKSYDDWIEEDSMRRVYRDRDERRARIKGKIKDAFSTYGKKIFT